PLFTAALEIVDRLAIWSTTRPERDQLFQRWMAGNGPVADWGSRSALTAVVIGALRWMRERGLILPVASSTVPVREALSGMDWLDTGALQEALGHPLLSAPEEAVSSEAAAIPVHLGREALSQPFGRHAARRATPRQIALFEHLAPLLDELRVALDSLSSP